MRYNGIYTTDREGRIRAFDLDKKDGQLDVFNTLDEFKTICWSKENRANVCFSYYKNYVVPD